MHEIEVQMDRRRYTRKPEGKEIRKELYGERNTDTAQATCAL